MPIHGNHGKYFATAISGYTESMYTYRKAIHMLSFIHVFLVVPKVLKTSASIPVMATTMVTYFTES